LPRRSPDCALGLLLGSVAGPGKKVLVGLWCIVGVAEWVAYFVDYHTPRGHQPLLDGLGHFGTVPEYFLTLLGSALFWQPEHALSGGLVIGCLDLAMLLATYGRGALREHPFWISLLFYSLFILATITLGRSGMFRVWQAAISRYTTFSVLAVASVYVMLAKMVLATRASVLRTVLLIALFGTILLNAAISYRNGIEVGRGQEASRERAAHVLETYRSQPDARLAATLYPRAQTVRRRAPCWKGSATTCSPNRCRPIQSYVTTIEPTYVIGDGGMKRLQLGLGPYLGDVFGHRCRGPRPCKVRTS
jgi:hypothetical protein